jgi:two-component system NtrC family sensor kinase
VTNASLSPRGAPPPRGLARRLRASLGPQALETLRRWRLGRISLRSRITGAFTLVVVGGTAVSTLIGSRIITNALLGDVRSRTEHGLEAALAMYAEDLDTTIGAVARAAETAPAHDVTGRLDFLRYVPRGASSPRDACFENVSLRGLVDAAAAGRRAGATEVLSAECLGALGLAERARVEGLASALALVSAARVGTHGLVFGGLLLNRRTDTVDRVKRMVYGDAKHDDRDVGSASIFLGDVRVAASARTPDSGVGTRASPDVAATVIGGGSRWQGRTRATGGWSIAAYEPLRNHAGEVIGMLGVGMLEAPILMVRTDVMLTFLAVCAFGLVIVFALTYLITRRTISPLEEMVAATKKIAAGDLAVRVSVASDDEIGDLAASFNDMLSSLEATKRELEEWGHTLEDKVKDRTDQLVTVQAQMVRSEKLASIGRLAAGVAHSINNPLGGILSLSMLAAEGCKDPALGADLETISRQALRCREIVKGLLDFSRQSDVRVTRTDINAIVESAVLLLQRQAVFHNVTIERRMDPGAPRVLIDPGQLQEAVTNLLVNAVDAMENGGTLTVETGTAAGAGEALIRVADTGCGIPEKNLPYLFEPFFTTKKVGKGTGLGLAIVHGIVTGAGGSIEVATASSGTRFTIHLPLAPAESEGHGGELAGAGAGQSAGGR